MSRLTLKALPLLEGILVAGILVGCRRGPPVVSGPEVDASAVVQTSDALSEAMPTVLASRCHALRRGVLIDQSDRRDAIDIGDGLALPEGYAVGLVHQASTGRMAAVALLGAAAEVVRVVDLGPILGDAAPPRLVSCASHLLAGAFALRAPTHRVASEMRRDLALYAVESAAPQVPVSYIPQQGDDSFAFDLACTGAAGLAVWDETAAAPLGVAARGVIRAASFGVAQRSGDARDVSPPDSDAEMPRIVPYRSGFLVLWIARRPESTSSGGGRETDAASIESTGEERTYGWLEMIAVDTAGAATGPVRHLTSTSGHVSAYDVQSRPTSPKALILVVARDDGEQVDGSGGALLRVRMQNDGVEPPVEWPTDGLGRGAPMFVDGPALWLAWVDAREEMRLLPLDERGETVAPPSAEESLTEARPLLSLSAGRQIPGLKGPSSPNPDGEMLVAVPRAGEKGSQLGVFACPR